MTDEIYILKNDGQLEAMREQNFDLEDVLQQLVADHPELLSGQQIDPDNPRRWILVNREQGISDIIGGGNRWALDHLLIDQDAIPTLVEVKRSENSEIRRTIVGQMLDYAAHARHRVRRLKAVANMVHSAATLTRPRSRNLRAICCSLMIPKTGSTSCFLSL